MSRKGLSIYLSDFSNYYATGQLRCLSGISFEAEPLPLAFRNHWVKWIEASARKTLAHWEEGTNLKPEACFFPGVGTTSLTGLLLFFWPHILSFLDCSEGQLQREH